MFHLAERLMSAAVSASASRHVAAAVAVALIHSVQHGPLDDDELCARMTTECAALSAHASHNAMKCRPSHNLGLATFAASDLLSPTEKRVLRGLRRKANEAKHRWPA